MYLAFISRVFNLSYLLLKTPHEQFNRISDKYYDDLFYNYFSTFPLAFYWLAALSYLTKWIHSYYSTMEWVNFDANLAETKWRRTKYGFICIWIVSIVAIIIDSHANVGYELIRLYFFIFYISSSIGLVITSKIYLSKLK